MEKRFGLEEITPVGVPRQEHVVVVGRICCEAAEGKINRASILLEVCRLALFYFHFRMCICFSSSGVFSKEGKIMRTLCLGGQSINQYAGSCSSRCLDGTRMIFIYGSLVV